LDYGTGTGFIALQLYLSVKNIITVDSAKNMLAILQKKIDDKKIVPIKPLKWSIGDDINQS
jgi:ubiquinone/menaquinone biosynthesis C-methylase UbiE